MKSTKLIILWIVAVLLFSSFPAYATLYTADTMAGLPDWAVWDDTNSQVWTRDLNKLAFKDYQEQINYIAGGNLQNNAQNLVGTWRMASLADMNNLWAYDVDSLYDAFIPNIVEDPYPSYPWYGQRAEFFRGRYDSIPTYDNAPENSHYLGNFDYMNGEYVYSVPYGTHPWPLEYWSTPDSYPWEVPISAWTVIDTNGQIPWEIPEPSPVPEPASFFMVMAGLSCLIFCKKRKYKI